jgi:hypothetical protein
MRIPLCRCTLIGVLFLSRAFGSACLTNPLSVYDAKSFSCTINGEIVDNFTFSGSGYSALSDTQIMVTPSFTPSSYTLAFSSIPSGGFSVPSGQSVLYQINFTWDPVVVRAEDDLSDPTHAPGSSTVTTNLCAGGLFGVTCTSPTNTLTVSDNGISPILTASASFAPVTVVDTQTSIALNGGPSGEGGSSSITGFSETVFTPEPGTVLLVAMGLLLLWRRPQPTL